MRALLRQLKLRRRLRAVKRANRHDPPSFAMAEAYRWGGVRPIKNSDFMSSRWMGENR